MTDTPEVIAHRVQMLRNVYRKLDGLPLGFGIPAYKDDMSDDTVVEVLGGDINDALRESRMTIDSIDDGSLAELQIENRTMYYALRRFRLTASTYFKFSTAVDGKTVDKTNIPKMLSSIIAEYDAEYKKWRSGNAGNLWNRTVGD